MVDRCHGSARGFPNPDDALFRELKRDISSRPNPASRVARAQMRRARKDWIVVAGQAPATVPMWTSRLGWLDELREWADSDTGRSERAAVNLSAAMLLRVAQVLADRADHGSGRNCAVTNAAAARAADCSVRTIRTVRGVLRRAGLAVEIFRGTGSAATPGFRRRASIWHLVSRRDPVDNSPVCRLPPSRRDRRSSLVGNKSPSGRTRPTRRSRSHQTTATPRPLHTQKLAAGVIAGSIGLEKVHPGHICEALTRSGLDLDAWTARQITNALNADMRQRGWTWPERIERPGAFLASRLRHLPQRPPIAPTPMAPAEPEIAPTPAGADARAAAKAYFQQHRRRSETSRTTPKSVRWYTHQPAGRARQVNQSPRGTA